MGKLCDFGGLVVDCDWFCGGLAKGNGVLRGIWDSFGSALVFKDSCLLQCFRVLFWGGLQRYFGLFSGFYFSIRFSVDSLSVWRRTFFLLVKTTGHLYASVRLMRNQSC